MPSLVPKAWQEPSFESLQHLQAAAVRDVQVARIVLGLFEAIVGRSELHLFADPKWKLHDIESLPLKERRAARAVLDWGRNPRLILNGLLCAQATITDAVWKMRRNSPLGRRHARIANGLRKKYPGLKPDGRPRPANLQPVEVLSNDWGRPLGLGTLRRLHALEVSQIEIRKYREPFYAAWAERSANIELAPDGYTIQRIAIDVPVEKIPPPRVIYGVLEDFFETGTEGVVWSVFDENERGYDGLHSIDEGDHLTILDPQGCRIWAGKIRCDHKAGYRRYPGNPRDGQPSALGYWVRWTQRGFKPDDWARFFIRGGREKLRGILRKR